MQIGLLGLSDVTSKLRCLRFVKRLIISLVRPQLEFASVVWDPHMKAQISQIEQVQRRAARWTAGNFDRQSSVTEMVK